MVQDVGAGNQAQKIVAIHHGCVGLHMQHRNQIIKVCVFLELPIISMHTGTSK